MIRRIARFALPTAMTTLAPLLCVVFITHLHGASAFVSLGLGQALGGLAAIAITWGWDVNGPQTLMSLGQAAQRQALLGSLHARLLLFLLACPILLTASSLLAPDGFHLLAASTTIAVASQGLSPTWWLAGLGKPLTILYVDAGPRALAAAIAAPSVFALGPNIYPMLTVGAVGASYLFFHRRVLKGTTRPNSMWRSTATNLRRNASTAGVSMSAAAYSTTTLPIMQAVSPAGASAYASAARLLSYWSLSTITTNNALIGTIHSKESLDVRSATRKAVWIISIQSAALALIMIILAPIFSNLLFGIELRDRLLVWSMAAAFALNGINTGLSKYVLIPRGAVRRVLFSTIAAALVGLITVVPLISLFGAGGGMMSVAFAELATMTALAISMAARHTSSSASAPRAGALEARGP